MARAEEGKPGANYKRFEVELFKQVGKWADYIWSLLVSALKTGRENSRDP